MTSEAQQFVNENAAAYGVGEGTTIRRYLERKTKASDRGSKARRSLGNLYALYVLTEDFLNGNLSGSTFTELMRRMKALPFGAKLQNHPLDNRLNDEVRRQYGVSDEMLPVQPADLGDGKKARKISVALLSEDGMNPQKAAEFVVTSINQYITIISDNQTAFLNEIEAATSPEEISTLIESSFDPNADARLFEIVSYALLYLHFKKTEVTLSINGKSKTGNLHLFRTGRTNANDGGIDFVLKPLGEFFQVTETLDFKKYFLDFDKINRFPLNFVIKTELSSDQVREAIRNAAQREYEQEIADRYMALFHKIFTLNELRNILGEVKSSTDRTGQLQSTVVENFKLEYGLLD